GLPGGLGQREGERMLLATKPVAADRASIADRGMALQEACDGLRYCIVVALRGLGRQIVDDEEAFARLQVEVETDVHWGACWLPVDVKTAPVPGSCRSPCAHQRAPACHRHVTPILTNRHWVRELLNTSSQHVRRISVVGICAGSGLLAVRLNASCLALACKLHIPQARSRTAVLCYQVEQGPQGLDELSCQVIEIARRPLLFNHDLDQRVEFEEGFIPRLIQSHGSALFRVAVSAGPQQPLNLSKYWPVPNGAMPGILHRPPAEVVIRFVESQDKFPMPAVPVQGF